VSGQAQAARPPGRLPEWLRRSLPAGAGAVRRLIGREGLSTVCLHARCPNAAECFSRGTLTFMILGDRCTRSCRFCAVAADGPPAPVDPDEPQRVADAAGRLGLRHVVITSVTRDDLLDGGAGQFANVVRAVRDVLPRATVEILTPDFQGDPASIDAAVAAGPDVFNHNVETVPRLYGAVRPQADYRRSLAVLARAGRHRPGRPLIKSGLMVGMGERPGEIAEILRDLRSAGCDILTIGQYLAPSPEHHPVARFVPPEEFEDMAGNHHHRIILPRLGPVCTVPYFFYPISFHWGSPVWVDCIREPPSLCQL